MQTSKVWLDALVIGGRLRKDVDVENVGHLAESMARIGLQHPISVWMDGEDALHLVAGLHRVRAAEKLGWEQIDAVILQMDEDDRIMWEAVENLHRANLTADDRRESIRAYHEAWVRKQGLLSQQSASKVDPPKMGRPTGTVSQVAADLGVSKDTVRRAVNPPAPKPVKPAPIADDPLNDFETLEKQVAAIMSAWNKASREARDEFLLRIDRPAFDNTRAA